MTVCFNALFNIKYSINSFSDKLSTKFFDQRIKILAIAILGCVILYTSLSYCFKARKMKVIDSKKTKKLTKIKENPLIKEKKVEEKKEPLQQEKKIDSKKKVIQQEKKKSVPLNSSEVHKKEEKKKLYSAISNQKSKAIEEYKNDPNKCKNFTKRIIFNDIKFITSQGGKGDIISVVDLILYLTKSREVNLKHALSARVIVDVLKECNKETSEQLSEWLGKEQTFHPELLKDCLEVFIQKQKQSLPFSPYAIELLMKIYKEKGWSQIKNSKSSLILPSNHPILVDAMAILIKERPNEDRVITLGEWMINQKEYDLHSFSRWTEVFHQKEQEKKAMNLFYPLLDKMVSHFKKKWNANHLKSLDVKIANYLKPKGII